MFEHSLRVTSAPHPGHHRRLDSPGRGQASAHEASRAASRAAGERRVQICDHRTARSTPDRLCCAALRPPPRSETSYSPATKASSSSSQPMMRSAPDVDSSKQRPSAVDALAHIEAQTTARWQHRHVLVRRDPREHPVRAFRLAVVNWRPCQLTRRLAARLTFARQLSAASHPGSQPGRMSDASVRPLRRLDYSTKARDRAIRLSITPSLVCRALACSGRELEPALSHD